MELSLPPAPEHMKPSPHLRTLKVSDGDTYTATRVKSNVWRVHVINNETGINSGSLFCVDGTTSVRTSIDDYDFNIITLDGNLCSDFALFHKDDEDYRKVFTFLCDLILDLEV